MSVEAVIDGIGVESSVPDNPGAVDASFYVNERFQGEVTLLPDAQGGGLDTWGELSHWASHGAIRWVYAEGADSKERIQAIVEAVQLAVKNHLEGA